MSGTLCTPEQDTRYHQMYGDLRFEEFHRAALRAKMNAPVGSMLCSLRIEELWSLARERAVRQRDWSPFMRSLSFNSSSPPKLTFPAPPPFNGGLHKALAAAAEAEHTVSSMVAASKEAATEEEEDATAVTSASPNAATTPNAAAFLSGLATAIAQLPTPSSSSRRTVLSPLTPHDANKPVEAPAGLPKPSMAAVAEDATSHTAQHQGSCAAAAVESNNPSSVVEKLQAPGASPAVDPSPTLLHARVHLSAVLGGLEDELRKAELEAALGTAQGAEAWRAQGRLVRSQPGWVIALANLFCIPCVAGVSPLVSLTDA